VTGKGVARVRRTNISVTLDAVNVSGTLSKLGCQIQWQFPLNGEFDSADLSHLIAILGDLVFTTGSLAVDPTKLAALLQGQS